MLKYNLNYKIEICILIAMIVFHSMVSFAGELKTGNDFIISGIEHCQKGDFRTGISLFSRAIKIQHLNYYAYLNRGVAFRDLNETENAKSDFNKCVELEPDNPDAYLQLGYLSSNSGDFNGAIKHYTKSIELDPNNYHAYLHRGAAFQDLKDSKNAISDLNKCIELEPDYPGAYFQMGFLSSYNGDFTEAIKYYVKTIELDPKFTSAYGTIGIMYSMLENYDEAIEILNSGISIDPNQPMFYIVRGQILDMQGRCVEAIRDFEKGMSFDSEQFNTNIYIAWVLSTCPDDEIRNGKKALKILNDHRINDEEDVETLKSLAAAYAELEKFDQAISFQKKAIKKAEERKSSGKFEEIYFSKELEMLFQQLKSYQRETPWRTKAPQT